MHASRYKYTCAHCGCGRIVRLPMRCPECNRWLSEPIERKKTAK